jgi:uncharacterized protein (UPF0548 family)
MIIEAQLQAWEPNPNASANFTTLKQQSRVLYQQPYNRQGIYDYGTLQSAGLQARTKG